MSPTLLRRVARPRTSRAGTMRWPFLGLAVALALAAATPPVHAQSRDTPRGGIGPGAGRPTYPMPPRGPSWDQDGPGIGGIVGGVIGILPRPRPRPQVIDEDIEDEPPPRGRPAVVESEPERPRRPQPGARPGPRKPPAQSAAVPAARPNPRKPPVQSAAAPEARRQAAKPPTAPGRTAQRPPAPPVAPRSVPPVPAVAADLTIVPDEVLFETRPGVTAGAVEGIARSLRLTRISSQPIALIGSTLHRYRITDRRPVAAVVDALRRDARIASVQPNSIYRLQQGAPSGGQPPGRSPLADAQYALAKMRIAEAHRLATGEAVRVAVIDSMVDATHPELAGAVTAAFDPAGGKATPHTHGTGVAGILAARSQLTGIAPRVEVLAIRAFTGERGKPGADGTTFHIVQGIDWAAAQGARVVNMSFAGPRDELLGRILAAARRRGIVLVAAAGNAGPTSQPLYPAADENVIAVSASDAEDRIYPVSNRGGHICVAAPGVDILMPAPGNAYQLSSGTSMAAPHVAGVVALLLQAQPTLMPEEVRTALRAGARDLGPVGQDPDFGAGFADALAVLEPPDAKPRAGAATGGPTDAVAVGEGPAATPRTGTDPAAQAAEIQPRP